MGPMGMGGGMGGGGGARGGGGGKQKGPMGANLFVAPKGNGPQWSDEILRQVTRSRL